MAEALSVSHPIAAASSPRTVDGPAAATPPVGTLTTLVVENMHCGGCMRKVETALSAVPGVRSARANLSARRVTVDCTTPAITDETLIDALDAAGFKASALLDRKSEDEGAQDSDLLRRLGVAGFAAANVMLLSVSVWAGQANDMPASLVTMFHWLSAIIAIPAVAYAGRPFFTSGWHALRARRLNMDVPISLGVLLATTMSLYQTLSGHEHVYFDAAITLLFFLLIGRTLDLRMRSRAAGAAENLLAKRATAATVVSDTGTVERIPTKALEPGMRVLVAAGERLPVDARLAKGRAEIDESLITGESRPRTVRDGDQLYAGTVNLAGPIEVIATAAEDATLLAEIARLMQSAEQARSAYVRLADRAAQIYAPAVHLLGLATFVGWMLIGAGWETALTIAIAVLIITCPCALALAVPVTQVVATGRLFRRGIIVKAADGLERLADVDTIVLDKTGTLTLGEPQLVGLDTYAPETLARAASLAARSRHPYARAIVRAADARAIAFTPAEDVRELTGLGLAAHLDGQEVRLGSAAHCDVETAPESQSTLYLRVDGGTPIGFVFEDQIRPDATRTIAALAKAGYRLEILSGDREAAVAEVAETVGIDTWHAARKPDQKIARISALESEGRRVLMVGDGLNDAPALAAGHASASPSTAADVSQTAADAVFQGAGLGAIARLLVVARSARRRSFENLAIALGYNCIFVPLAVLGHVTPLLAAIAMSASSIAVTANALRTGLEASPTE